MIFFKYLKGKTDKTRLFVQKLSYICCYIENISQSILNLKWYYLYF